MRCSQRPDLAVGCHKVASTAILLDVGKKGEQAAEYECLSPSKDRSARIFGLEIDYELTRVTPTHLPGVILILVDRLCSIKSQLFHIEGHIGMFNWSLMRFSLTG
jgi:hypothetical protein